MISPEALQVHLSPLTFAIPPELADTEACTPIEIDWSRSLLTDHPSRPLAYAPKSSTSTRVRIPRSTRSHALHRSAPTAAFSISEPSCTIADVKLVLDMQWFKA